MFLLLIFNGFLLGPRSSGGVPLGRTAVIETYAGLFLHVSPATLPVESSRLSATLRAMTGLLPA